MKKILTLFLGLLIVAGCSDSGKDIDDLSDNFDRRALLVNWADNIIIPSYQDYVTKVGELENSTSAFNQSPSLAGLEEMRSRWLSAYLSFQQVSMFEIGMAESLSMRNYTNVYPADVTSIEENVSLGDYNLQLPSTNDEQGFPALEYLLYGIGANDNEIVSILDTEHGKTYLLALTKRLNEMANSVLNDWVSGYRDEFVENSGSTATSSVNKITNDLMFYYEKALRAGKIGIPAGVFSGNPLSDRVEGLYSRVYTKQLFMSALDATENFFTGQAFNSSETGASLKSYLDFIDSDKEGEPLSNLILMQFESARSEANNMLDDFYQQVETDNGQMLMTYDELQKAVVLLKVDMFSALNIRIDFVDADGD